MCDAFKDASQGRLFFRPVMYSIPMGRGRGVFLQTNLRADDGYVDDFLFHPEA